VKDGRRTIIPVAGGKGGVGKSFVTANLAIALARRGHSTILVDLDLGNSNLHNFLGLENRYPGVGDYLRKSMGKRLDELLVGTKLPELRFLPGDGRMPFMANLTFSQKRLLLRELKQLRAEFVLLDLSAGTTFNTLDLFAITDSGILVTTPEYPAIMSLLVFTKNLLFRRIHQQLRKYPELVDLLNELSSQGTGEIAMTIDEFIEKLTKLKPDVVKEVNILCSLVRPRLVYNMAETVEDASVFSSIDAALQKNLKLECDHVGFIPYDHAIRHSLRRPEGLIAENVSPLTVETLDRLANRVVRFWDQTIEGSAALLENYAREVLSARQGENEVGSS
jgi:flagellar biosynthesis protein FlhG